MRAPEPRKFLSEGGASKYPYYENDDDLDYISSHIEIPAGGLLEFLDAESVRLEIALLHRSRTRKRK